MNTDLVNKIIRFRVDLLGTSEDTKPLDAPDSSTFYEVDTYKFFIKYGGEWVEQGAEETPQDDDSEPAENSRELAKSVPEVEEPVEEPIPEDEPEEAQEE